MPTYDYECATCGRFSALRSLSAFAEPVACPGCGTMAPRLLLSTPRLGGRQRADLSAQAVAPASSHAAGCGCCGAARTGRLRAEAVQDVS